SYSPIIGFSLERDEGFLIGSPCFRILVAKSPFEGTFYFSQARKGVDIPHREEKNDLFCGIFLHFLNSPPVSLRVKRDENPVGAQFIAPSSQADRLALGAMMNVNDQHQECHAERSEASVAMDTETLRSAQHNRIDGEPLALLSGSCV
ncbi:MAG TPA: hypothetical protein VKB35_07435, partial [Ktedonobacteraceae bacterium]|nr:hypothetical protein [Ktedonobacteraceae bacterium]